MGLAPINQSPLPLGNNTAPCYLALNQIKPNHKCAQLACCHSDCFNTVWLTGISVYHFI